MRIQSLTDENEMLKESMPQRETDCNANLDNDIEESACS